MVELMGVKGREAEGELGKAGRDQITYEPLRSFKYGT